MPEEVEIETNELQETLDELHEERLEREKEKKENAWTRYIALSTAFLAVIAAIGALQSGALVNEAMIAQIKASDTWNEYQADKQKAELFTTQANALMDRGVAPAPEKPKAEKPAESETKGESSEATQAAPPKAAHAGAEAAWHPASPPERLREYMTQAEKELSKTEKLSEEAKKQEEESSAMIERHHHFAWSVALIQVAIALSAIAALTRIRFIWFVSLLIGACGVVLFVVGLLPGK